MEEEKIKAKRMNNTCRVNEEVMDRDIANLTYNNKYNYQVN